jgi:hypothetical protein
MSKSIHTVKSNHVALNKLHQKNTTAYRFADPDPILDLLRAAISDAMRDNRMSIVQIAADAMCAYQTVARIVDGETRRPQNSTVDRILKACGFTRPILRAMLDVHDMTLNVQEMYDAMEAVITKKMSHAEIVALLKKTIGKK